MDFEERSAGSPGLEEYVAGYVGLVIAESFSDSHLALFDSSFFPALPPAFTPTAGLYNSCCFWSLLFMLP